MKVIVWGVLLVAMITPCFAGESMSSDQAFAKWLRWQRVYHPRSIATAKTFLTTETLSTLDEKITEINTEHPAAEKVFSHMLGAAGREPVKRERFVKKLMQDLGAFYDRFLPRLADALKHDNYDYDATTEIGAAVDYYTSFVRFLFAPLGDQLAQEYLFSFAGDLFLHSFATEHHKTLMKYLADPAEVSTCRSLYSLMWYYLVGDGWKHYNQASLDRLKSKVKEGKRVVYIAGGTDIYQLLLSGIYAIDVIDPMLPTQDEYLSEGWNFFIHPPSEDASVRLKTKQGDLLLVLKSHEQIGEFEAKLSDGSLRTIPKTITQWHVKNNKGKILGTVTFYRRFCDQEDFSYASDRVYFISFNEMYYLTLDDVHGGWGIRPEKFNPKLKLYVKQLPRPIDKQVLANIHEAESQPFNFIFLGSVPT